jgi:non-specific serine/threonine protein kinase
VGGAGKTRLALEVAGRLIDHYPEGVWLVEFASLSDPALVPRAVATVLEVPEQPDQDPVQGLLTALQARELLLALDNCEHLVTACAQLVELLLRSCPGLRVLATSREPLRIEGERTAHILPLSLPDATRRPLVEDLLGCESVRLLVERVQFRQPSFLLTEGNGWAVSEICRKLEGIPLALELAAARAGALSVEQIAARLEDALGVLTAGSRTALSRQQTLQGALDWSYDLLSESEQRLFCRLAVFAGGWDLEAAEAMADRREEALDLLSRLVDKSLVVTEVEGEAVRFRLLEPIRQYAELRLRQSGDAEEAHRRHAACYLRLAERARPLLFGPDQEVWLDRLEAEQDNMRAALSRYHSEIGEARTVLRLASKLWPFWSVRYPHEGGSWLEAALTEAQDAAPPDRAEALQGAAIIAYWQRDYDRAAAHGEEGLELYRGLHDLQGAAACLNTLGMVAMERGELQPATKLFEEALDLYRQAGDRLGMADALGNLGCLTNELGDLQRALVLSEESLALCREVGDPLLIAAAVANVGATARELGECGRALECFGEAVRISHKLGEQRHTAFCLEGIALTLCRLQSWWLSA